MMSQEHWRPQASWPVPNAARNAELRSTDNRPLAELINGHYDSTMYSALVDEYCDYSGFHNYGYWTPQTRSQREASEKLVDELVGFFPSTKGNILDVACGMGASTRRLLRQYPASRVTGINISEKQLATCRQKAPGCRFLNMDATDLKFPDDSFDNVLCVEAAFHFDTRENFLREAYRVMKPGAGLALSDILARSRLAASLMKRLPTANFIPDVERYRSALERVGFKNVHIVEALEPCWGGFRDHSLAFLRSKVLSGQVPVSFLRRVANGQRWKDWAFSNYLLVSARKPRRVFRQDGRK
jgi:ubiquinone/menaquinone biosynthesis C-methylase UbiE